MQRFDAIVRPGHFAAAGLGPPLVCLVLIASWGNGSRAGDLTLDMVMVLLAVAQLTPLVVLAWVLCSVAAYTIEPGRLVIHRVLWDHADSLPNSVEVHRDQRGLIRVVKGRRVRRLRPIDANGCIAALQRATGSREDRPPSTG